MFLRALFAFLVLPGVVGGLLPWLIVAGDPARGQGWRIGAVVLLLGLMILLWCVRDFYVSGKGTLAPWDPPKHLVVVGLYRFCRNPMYVGVLTLVAGWSLLAASRRLAIYTVILGLGFHLRVLFYEEPTLARLFPDAWQLYRASVNRWCPSVRAATSSRGRPVLPSRS
ncbi:MAG TPA: methyltransferase [Candidatus Acidoferrales bacterium]|nr:methyltransferase [Candidatus Acidoferrales bacterium]